VGQRGVGQQAGGIETVGQRGETVRQGGSGSVGSEKVGQ
jgi:hypothetical protein